MSPAGSRCLGHSAAVRRPLTYITFSLKGLWQYFAVDWGFNSGWIPDALPPVDKRGREWSVRYTYTEIYTETGESREKSTAVEAASLCMERLCSCWMIAKNKVEEMCELPSLFYYAKRLKGRRNFVETSEAKKLTFYTQYSGDLYELLVSSLNICASDFVSCMLDGFCLVQHTCLM